MAETAGSSGWVMFRHPLGDPSTLNKPDCTYQRKALGKPTAHFGRARIGDKAFSPRIEEYLKGVEPSVDDFHFCTTSVCLSISAVGISPS